MAEEVGGWCVLFLFSLCLFEKFHWPKAEEVLFVVQDISSHWTLTSLLLAWLGWDAVTEVVLPADSLITCFFPPAEAVFRVAGNFRHLPNTQDNDVSVWTYELYLS